VGQKLSLVTFASPSGPRGRHEAGVLIVGRLETYPRPLLKAMARAFGCQVWDAISAFECGQWSGDGIHCAALAVAVAF
jgi:hypothetical protein